jgi:hypothetical protein
MVLKCHSQTKLCSLAALPLGKELSVPIRMEGKWSPQSVIVMKKRALAIAENQILIVQLIATHFTNSIEICRKKTLGQIQKA